METFKTAPWAVIVFVTVANYLVAHLGGELMFNIGRWLICIICGWLIVSVAGASVVKAFLVGPYMFLIDHIILTGGSFAIDHMYRSDLSDNTSWLALGGVFISYLLFAPVYALASGLAGVLGRRMNSLRKEHEGNTT